MANCQRKELSVELFCRRKAWKEKTHVDSCANYRSSCVIYIVVASETVSLEPLCTSMNIDDGDKRVDIICSREIRKIREKNLDNQDTMQVGADQKKKLLRSR